MGMAGAVAGLMTLYGYHLGYRRHVENQVKQVVPDSLLRCPFVMGILSKAGSPQPTAIPPTLASAGRQSLGDGSSQQLRKLSADSLQGRRG
jgi:hypothetical protein